MTVAATVRIFAALAGLLCATPALAAGERATATLDWYRSEAAAECLDGATLAARIEAGLHRTVFVPPAQADLVIKVSLNKSESEDWLAAIDLEDPHGRKLGHRELTMHAAQCSAIDESLALVVLLMVDVTRESVQPQPEPAQSVPVVAPKPLDLKPFQGEPAGIQVGLFLNGSTRLEQPPGLGRGLTLGGELGPARGWLLQFDVTAWAPTQTDAGPPGVKFRLQTVDANICGTGLLRWHTEYLLCVGQQIGYLNSKAFGFDENRTQSSLLYDLTLRAGVTWLATSALGVRLCIGAAIPLVQDEFFGTRADGSTVRLLSRATLVPLADLGISVRFGK